MKCVVFLADGFEECEALIPVDILRRAGVETVMASVTGRADALSSRRIRVQADASAEDCGWADADCLVLPGGRRGTENLRLSPAVCEACLAFAGRKLIAAICAAPTVLAGLGLLEGRRATCHPDFEGEMRGALLTREPVTRDGLFLTGQGLGASFAFAFALAELLAGRERAERIRGEICWR